MKMAIRLFGFGVVLGVIFAVTTASVSQQTTQDPVFADSANVELGELPVRVDATGSVEAAAEVPLSFGMQYSVVEVLVDEGDSVRAGDVLAVLDTTDYELALASAETELARQQNAFDNLIAPPRDVDVDAAEAALDAAEAAQFAAWMSQPSEEEIEIARLNIELAQNELWQGQLERDQLQLVAPEFRNLDPNTNARAQDIFANNGVEALDTAVDIAEAQFDATLNDGPDGTYGSAREAITSAEIAIDNLYNPEMRDIELAAMSVHQAALNVESIGVQIVDLQIVAPFDGIVIENNLNVGELPPNGPALIIADTNTFTVDLEIDETDVIGLRSGLPVTLTADALPETTLTGRISSVDLLPIEGEAVPTYRATITLESTLEAVRPGMSVNASVEVGELNDVLLIPARFLQTEEGETFVFVVQNNEIARQPVTIGRQVDSNTQILSGLQAGQRVVIPAEGTTGGNILTRIGGN